jgi:hypothetical protein
MAVLLRQDPLQMRSNVNLGKATFVLKPAKKEKETLN